MIKFRPLPDLFTPIGLALTLSILAGCSAPSPTPPEVPYLPPLAVISPTNAARISELAQLPTLNVEQIAWSPNGQRLVIASAAGIYLYDVESLSELYLIYVGPKVRSVAFSPDGTTFASASFDNAVRLWRAEDGTLQHELEGLENNRYSATWSYTVAFSPDGETVAAGGGDDIVRLWQASDGMLQQEWESGLGAVHQIAFSPDGRLLAIAGAGKDIQIRQVSDGALLHTLQGHIFGVNSVTFSSDGQMLASASFDKTVRLWQVDSGTLLCVLEHPRSVYSVAFAPNQEVLASRSTDDKVRLWSVQDGTLLHTIDGLGSHQFAAAWSYSVAFSPDGKVLASGGADGVTRLWGVAEVGAPD